MKKFIIIMLIALVSMVSGAELADTVIANTTGITITPTNIQEIELLDGVGDTITDSSVVVFGPYSMVSGRSEKAYKGFQFYSDAMGGTTPIAAIAYQLSHSSAITDTITTNWVTVDTLAATGASSYVDLSSFAGKFIYFRIHNYDATSDVMGKVIVDMKKDN